MRKYIGKRILTNVMILFIIISLNFFIFRVLPGNPMQVMFRHTRMSSEMWDHMVQQFGLDKPLLDQYFTYLEQTLRGNIGFSYHYKMPVAKILVERMFNTLLLVIPMLIITPILGIIIGALAAWKRGTKIDISSLVFALITYSMPTFWFGMILIIVFAYYLGLFPTHGMYNLDITFSNSIERVLNYLLHIMLPLLTISIVWIGEFIMIMRNSMIDVLTEDYIVTARAKGLKNKTIFLDYAIRNSLLPMTTLIAMNIGSIVTGIITIETLFAWPGNGRLVYEALLRRDYPLLQGSFLFFAIIMIISNLIADITYAYLDPRIRY